ncbi:acyl-CoA dehydrogenase family protein [Streptomyces pseudovenezuelae]|uniref:acyl-CoA dehydrogenase family protein n=1 Tax=Streptomyces pseudovenezuelae TaxID=67350 RepID=UPI002E81EF18|nr:acyl-CoA dehydrogenase family protein [Streptomyces pseudovenezuelae]WUA94227.1 acyl-CoA dehydrogenase family protein [Streptomyces pseudovenezuelae]
MVSAGAEEPAGAVPGGPGAALAGRSELPSGGAAPGGAGAASVGRSELPSGGVAPGGSGAALAGRSELPSAGAASGEPGAASVGRLGSAGVEEPVGAASGGLGAASAGRSELPSAGAARGGSGAGSVGGAEAPSAGAVPRVPGAAPAGRAGAGSVPGGGGWRLYGQVDQVLDGHSADLLLVAAHAGGFARSRTLLFLVPGDAPGLVRTRQTALDATRPQARVQLRDVEAELLGSEDGADVLGALARTGDTAAAVLACEAVGAADRVLETTVEYVGQREQFGRAIGSFQAVKHRLADVYVQLQAARSAAYFAAWAAAHDEQRVGGLALAQAIEALRTAAAEGIQLHGGIGFTWEHEAQRYFKRAAADELLFGPAHRLRAHAADAAQLFTRAEVTV